MVFGYHRMLATRCPFAIYYNTTATPAWSGEFWTAGRIHLAQAAH